MTRFGFVFLVLLAATALWAIGRPRSRDGKPADPAVERNQRLTALNGLVLYLLLVAIVVTVAGISGLLAAHYLVGFLLIPPVVLKLASTGYRFWRYYAGAGGPYRLAGPPPILLRFVVAPVLVVSTVVVLGSGLELWLFGLRFGSVWMPAHTVSAVVMLLAVTVHLLAHLRRSGHVLVDELAGRAREPPAARAWVVAGLVSGAVLALASLLYASPFPGNGAGT